VFSARQAASWTERHGVGHQQSTWPTHGCITCQARRGQCDFGAGRGTV